MPWGGETRRRSNFCQLIMATLKQFYKHLLIDYDRHLTTYTEQFFSCFLLLQPSGPCFYLPPYSWRLPASYPVQQAPDSVCVSMGPGLSRALLYDFFIAGYPVDPAASSQRVRRRVY